MATESAIRKDINATLFKSFVACKGNVPNFLDFCEVALSAVNHFKRSSKKMIFKNHHKTWTTKDNARLMRLYRSGLTEIKMSEKMHRSPKAVEFHIAKCLLDEQASGLTINGLAKKYKKTMARIISSMDMGENHSRHA